MQTRLLYAKHGMAVLDRYASRDREQGILTRTPGMPNEERIRIIEYFFTLDLVIKPGERWTWMSGINRAVD